MLNLINIFNSFKKIVYIKLDYFYFFIFIYILVYIIVYIIQIYYK